jgi:hypothetical protein
MGPTMTRTMSVFALDPGSTTGWAYVPDVPLTHSPAVDCDLPIACGQIAGEEQQQSLDLYRLIENCWPCAVVIEDFIPRQINKDRWFLSPVRITSQVTMLLWMKDRQWALQSASLAKTTISDDYLKRIDLYNIGQPHANDATRHLITYLRRVKNKGFGMYEDLIAPRGLNTMTPL